MKSRDKEIQIIKMANRASIVGKLLLGEINNWEDFLKVETDELESLPRRILKSGKKDIQKRLSKEIQKFCKKNFSGMTPQKLSILYEDIKALRGLEIPLSEFESNHPIPHTNHH